MFEVTNLLNERLIGKIPSTSQDGSYLSSNDCLLGRSIKSPTGQLNVTSSKRRIWFVQTMTDMFWKKWTTFYFASLIIRKKWHHEQRNLAINDVVILYDKDLPRGQWKIGVISKLFLASDKKFRHVLVKYKDINSKSYVEIERPVQRLVVLLPTEERDDTEKM